MGSTILGGRLCKAQANENQLSRKYWREKPRGGRLIVKATSRRDALLFLWSLFLVSDLVSSALAETFPNRAIRLITDSAPGSAIDVTARIIADGLSKTWSQPVVVTSMPGAGGALAARAAIVAEPDGYTLYMPSFSAFVVGSGTTAGLPITVPDHFVAISYLSGGPMFIAASPSLGIKTLPELVALARQHPGELTFGTNGPGRLTHLTGELLQLRAGVKLLMVPYSGGTSRVITDIAGGRISLIFEAYSGIAGALDSGQLIPLAVASSERLPQFPDLPTVAETYPDFEAGGWQILVAPAGTPYEIVRKVNSDVNTMLTSSDIRDKIERVGRYIRAMSPQKTTDFIRAEQRKWEPIQRAINSAH